MRGPAGHDRGRRRQEPGLHAAAPRPFAARCAQRCSSAATRRARAQALRGVCTLRVLRRRLEEAVRAAARRGPARRHRAAVAGVREPRHVSRLRASRRGIRASGAGSWRHERRERTLMAFARRSARAAAPCTSTALTLALALAHRAARAGDGDLGVDLDREPRHGDPFSYPRAPAAARAARRRPWRRSSFCDSDGAARAAVAAAAAAGGARCCCVVLVPGLGHVGQRQPPLAAARRASNFQVSELARVLVLIYVASYAVRREEELREHASRASSSRWLLLGARGAAAARGAGLRRRHGAVRHRLRRAVPRRRAPALRARR